VAHLHRLEGRFESKTEIGRRVSNLLSRDRPYTPTAINKWFNEGVVPDIATIAALAKVLQVDPGWLAFGDESRAPAPRELGNGIAERSEQPRQTDPMPPRCNYSKLAGNEAAFRHCISATLSRDTRGSTAA
jgi:transcriptional regulator with XRE-family HTH domain